MPKRPLRQSNPTEKPAKRLKGSVSKSSANQLLKTLAPSNEILQLNDDCLLIVFSHLSMTDLLALSATHPRFKEVLQDSRMFKKQKIDKQFFAKNHPNTSGHIYKSIGTMVKHVHVAIPTSDFRMIMPYLSNIDTLELTNVEHGGLLFRWNWDDLAHFPRVRCLRGNFHMDAFKWRTLFRHLSPTLEELDCVNVRVSLLRSLRKLSSLTIHATAVKNGLGALFKRNPKLNELRVRFDGWPRIKWANISTKCPIKKLHLDIAAVPTNALKSLPDFPHLRSFGLKLVKGNCEFLHAFMDKLSPKLQELTIDYDLEESWNSLEFDAKLARFKELKKLEIHGELMEDFSFKGICRAASLTHLTLNFDCAQQTLLLIDKLPKLKEMNNDLVELTNWNFAKKLMDNLRKEQRELVYNGSE